MEYDLAVEESALNINANPSISLSRNTPVALVVGAGGFLGSYISERLLEKNIQVVGVDNFLSGNMANLEGAVKDKRFHLIKESISTLKSLNLLRLDYAFFLAGLPETAMFGNEKQDLYKKGIANFLKLCSDFNPKIVFVSSIELYNNNLDTDMELLKGGEIRFARMVKEHRLNGRVIRLAPLYGPRMSFHSEDPVSRLIQASLLGELQKEQTSLDFSTRSLFVEDAADLVIRSVFFGGTAHKIYDGALIQPVKVTEVKQILLDPLWYEDRGFKPTEIPPWPTPNLKKSTKELSWKPKISIVRALKQTISFFKDSSRHIPKLSIPELEREAKEWFEEEHKLKSQDGGIKEEVKTEEINKKRKWGIGERLKKRWGVYLGVLIIIYGLIFPLGEIAFGAFNLSWHLSRASADIRVGDFSSAKLDLSTARQSLSDIEGISTYLAYLKKVPFLTNPLNTLDNGLSVAKEGVDGAYHAVLGSESLFKVTKVISGEDSSDPQPYFDQAALELSNADQQLSEVLATTEDSSFTDQLPTFIKQRNDDFRSKLQFYSSLVEKGRAVSGFLPEIIATQGKKSYLILFEDNLQIRGTGGYIPLYAKIDFENGHVKNIKVDKTANLDKNLTEHIEPPPELKSDAGVQTWSLSDSNFDPDFPVSAKRAEFFYNKEAGERVNGVMTLDLNATSSLLRAVDGSDSDFLKGFLDHNGDSDYLNSIESPLFNKIFFLSNQNWPSIISSLADSLASKHMSIFLDESSMFSYILSENWAGSLPRQPQPTDGVTNDFLAAVDSNMGGNLANYFIQRSFNLETSINSDGGVFHHLQIKYKNVSPQGSLNYKNRLRLYLPAGSKLTKASLGDQDDLSQIASFSDYGRAGYSTLLNVGPGEEKVLTLDYSLSEPLSFKDDGGGSKSSYRLAIWKQPGGNPDSFAWNVTFPANLKPVTIDNEAVTSGNQDFSISTDLSQDRLLSVTFSK